MYRYCGNAIARHNEWNAKYVSVSAMNAVTIGCNLPHDTITFDEEVDWTK